MNGAVGCLVALPYFILAAFVDMVRGGRYCPSCRKRCAHRTSVKGEWWECLDCGYREASVSAFDDVPWEVIVRTKPIKKFCCQYRWLSNFWYSWVEIDGKKYRTVEHGFQAMKTLDLEERERIRLCSSPAQAKRLGRKVALREDWEDVKVEVMLGLLRQKFSQKSFRDLLLSTGDQEIVEGNHWHDCEWGVCHCSRCGGKGKNMLGKLIMQVREELKPPLPY